MVSGVSEVGFGVGGGEGRGAYHVAAGIYVECEPGVGEVALEREREERCDHPCADESCHGVECDS